MTKLIGKGRAMRQLSPDDYSSEFERNYPYYRQWIERGLVKQVYDRGRFDDLCQDTFVKALTYLGRQGAKLPQTDYHLGNLLRVMAVQVAIDDYRKNKSKDYLYLLESEEDTQIPEPTVEGPESQISDFGRFQRVIAQFPPQQQDIVLAIVKMLYHGHNQKDIADELGVSKATVNAYVKRIREELHQTIDPPTEDLQRAEATHITDAIYNLISGVEGAIDVGKIDEYEVKARDRWYRQYDMKKNISEMRDAVFAGPLDMLIGKGMYSRAGIWIPNGCYVVNLEDLMPVNLDDLGETI